MLDAENVWSVKKKSKKSKHVQLYVQHQAEVAAIK